jgi:hypothetical protein
VSMLSSFSSPSYYTSVSETTSKALAMPFFATWLGVIILGITLFLGHWLRQKSNRKLPLPPGPPGVPLLKNLFDVPMQLEHLTYKKWGDKYGDIVHIEVLGHHFIILNSTKAAVDLLDQRSKIYSDRPNIPMIHETDL